MIFSLVVTCFGDSAVILYPLFDWCSNGCSKTQHISSHVQLQSILAPHSLAYFRTISYLKFLSEKKSQNPLHSDSWRMAVCWATVLHHLQDVLLQSSCGNLPFHTTSNGYTQKSKNCTRCHCFTLTFLFQRIWGNGKQRFTTHIVEMFG